MATGKTYLSEFLKVAPLSHAIWRSIEALAFSKHSFEKPSLDIGCGFGEFAGVVFDRLEMGIDISHNDLVKAENTNKYKELTLADTKNLPFKRGTYKTVVSVSVLEHVDDPQKAIAEVSRVLKKNGFFIFSVPTTELYSKILTVKLLTLLGLTGFSSRYISLHKKAFRHVSIHPTSWWQNALEENGFEVVYKSGTLAPSALYLHEIFLITALPSEFAKRLFGQRYLMMPKTKAKVLTRIFQGYIRIDRNSEINMFFVSRKK